MMECQNMKRKFDKKKTEPPLQPVHIFKDFTMFQEWKEYNHRFQNEMFEHT